MLIEAMLISGCGFSALVTASGLGYFDQMAEKVGLQKEGDLQKWQNNNAFGAATLLETEDMVEDIQTDIEALKSLFVQEEDSDDDAEEEEEEEPLKPSKQTL